MSPILRLTLLRLRQRSPQNSSQLGLPQSVVLAAVAEGLVAQTENGLIITLSGLHALRS